MKKQLMVKAVAYKVAGIAKLRKNLPTLTNLTAIRAVWHLMGAELYNGYLTAAVTHFHAMVNLVASVGGLDSLLWELKKLVIVSDTMIASARKTKPAFESEFSSNRMTGILEQ
ncbi:hypothetical protein AYL99_04505 [Fonsecaea erecta]|uniref:Uncharacterized protein n=1 Tax=Fonsecaea erecta TaxID=1367422 RepID=A0A178ZRK5_9EURO|nr:hypothetical protein AYL99_04505 [Fonsecaea erecta]OAP62302.1 hypothetical protein AYL99_04505 [Fonsecaea erecta]